MTGFYLFSDEIKGLMPLVLGEDRIFRAQPSRRDILDDRDVHVAVEDHGKRPRDRCRAHDQHMGMAPLFGKQLPLAHAEPVLFIRDDDSEISIDHPLRQQRMGADDEQPVFLRDPLV